MSSIYNNEVIVFLIAANLIVVGTAVFIFFILRIQQKRKQLFQKQLLEKEFKTREEALLQMSRDLHDDVGSSLSGIHLLTQLAIEQTPLSEKTADLLLKISNYTNEVIEKVSDMAWLMKSGQESSRILFLKLKTYGLACCARKGMAFCFPDLAPGQFDLSIRQRKALYLISKEAINNAVKYSGCTHLHYLIHHQQDRLKVEIRDDGRGFLPDGVGEGNGLKNMEARATEAGGRLRINSSIGRGTNIELEFTQLAEWQSLRQETTFTS